MSDRCDDPLFGGIPERVLLSNAPLVRVLGQVKFPRIAKIAEESYIADFQEAIRGEYPHFQSDTIQGVNIVVNDNKVEPRQVTTVIWRFFDAHRVLRVSLGPEAITLETASYVSRDDFLSRFEFILRKLVETIRPSLVQRVGFRYVDRLQDPSDLAAISEFVHPELLNVLQSGLVEHIDISMTEVRGATKEGKILARYGLAPPRFSHDVEMAPPVDVKSWVLDVDSYSTNCDGHSFDTQMLCAELDKVAARAYAFFRWSVTEKFLERFGAKQHVD
ncbi:TIGR04255 family protein [Rhodovulum sulfidophilum]|uniref:TIGR04255 family protein n=1 Tax=Rhodovulum sulfidophilum TaxID=35806 RepID=UPI001921FF04|nr:TIGR04255 family protein [Rhodovulum sulfidophilum]MBL3562226.1 TIGR04255 family protein [Rhodovulum sulfidophilum]